MGGLPSAFQITHLPTYPITNSPLIRVDSRRFAAKLVVALLLRVLRYFFVAAVVDFVVGVAFAFFTPKVFLRVNSVSTP